MDEKAEMIRRIQNLIGKSSKNKSQILRELHLSTSTFTDWEKGKGNPSSSAIIKLAQYFDVTTDYLLFGTANTKNTELSPEAYEWLKLFELFSDHERQNLLDMLQDFPDERELADLLNGLKRLSMQERKICIAFIHGILAEKELTD